ncbi:hypothetical protein C1645_838035 [Glomus cerebriforme]|uniref:Bowman-Birk serine protease inhibitors family domain-containing protein n=1 Tax=Glomus cerebriforme TaxID=658196 RepID=A0A397SEG7_9GLOM|nr:hypothetical protein C1645_838035 [Glomus cerebriforme]
MAKLMKSIIFILLMLTLALAQDIFPTIPYIPPNPENTKNCDLWESCSKCFNPETFWSCNCPPGVSTTKDPFCESCDCQTFDPVDDYQCQRGYNCDCSCNL